MRGLFATVRPLTSGGGSQLTPCERHNPELKTHSCCKSFGKEEPLCGQRFGQRRACNPSDTALSSHRRLMLRRVELAIAVPRWRDLRCVLGFACRPSQKHQHTGESVQIFRQELLECAAHYLRVLFVQADGVLSVMVKAVQWASSLKPWISLPKTV